MVDADFQGVGTCITRSQTTIAQYIVTQMILDLCECSDQSPRARVSRRWQEQDSLDLEVAKKKSAAAAESDGAKTAGEEE